MKNFIKKLLKWILIIFVILFVISLFIDDEEVEASDSLSKQKIVRSLPTTIKGNSNDKVNIFIYMNGSDLESNDQEASTDINEMLNASYNENVNILIQTMGTKSWAPTHSISSDRSQRYKIENQTLKLVDDSLGQLDCTDPKTLSDFIKWGKENYESNRNILIFWNHGGGPVYGFGYDEHQSQEAALTIDEIGQALKDGGVFFDFIGMDCCLMSSLEVACMFYDYCNYTILSEDFESGFGWEYTNWLSEIAQNPSIEIKDLAKTIINDTVNKNAVEGEKCTLALIDESYMNVLFTAWKEFAYKNTDTLKNNNYSQEVKGNTRALPRMKKGFFSDLINFFVGGTSGMEDYYITDIMAVAQNIDSEESNALSSALDHAISYYNATNDESALTGISVTIPYGDQDFYNSLQTIFKNCGFDDEYINWLGNFTNASGSNDFYDYSDWDDNWSGWDDYSDDYDWNENDWIDSYDYDYDWDNWSCGDDNNDSWEFEYDDYFFDEEYDDWYYDSDEGSFWDFLFNW